MLGPIIEVCQILHYNEKSEQYLVHVIVNKKLYQGILTPERIFKDQESAEKYQMLLKLGGKA
jgi:hypothetical protein